MANNPVWSAPPNAPSGADRALVRRRRLLLWGGIVWVALAPLSLGLLAAFTFSFAAAKRRSVATVIAAVVFSAALVGLLLTVDIEETIVFDALFIGNLVVSTSAALILRPHVFPLPAAPPPPAAPAPPTVPAPPSAVSTPATPHAWTGHVPVAARHAPNPTPSWPRADHVAPAATNAPSREATEQRRTRREEARALAHQDPTTAIELGIGRPDRATSYDDGGLVDLNRAPQEALAQLPGVGAHGARAIVLTRTELGPFVSVADAMIRADIPPGLEAEVAEYAVVF
ncbi:helix-hairpin-helix domain-containing protein [Spiractinospora alimapuensis]|uniref:ComEA family DNA-binding protein n=1 Tax=Spiractinospora alimapuensis TaxID=2820884 RepID=UPI001F32A431|nr:helix-hairpin-helix domain-containing protein [Spiractinospora alimapuensis]QVQ53924.1 helix-hairpin-helix domain-containing protein [Spiractinospora alimapuensis]